MSVNVALTVFAGSVLEAIPEKAKFRVAKSLSPLPMAVKKSLDKNFVCSVVVQIVETSNDDGVVYSILLDYKNKRYNVQLDDAGDLMQIDRIKNQ